MGIKREAPSRYEVMSWNREFSNGSELKAHFYLAGLIFILTYQNAGIL